MHKFTLSPEIVMGGGKPDGEALRSAPYGLVCACVKKGFSLVEMLVVIAVIGILSGLLFPAIGIVSSSAKNARCASNIRQMGIALAVYAEDFERMYPALLDAAGPGGKRWNVVLYEHVNQSSYLGDYNKGALRNSSFVCPQLTSVQLVEAAVAGYGMVLTLPPSVSSDAYAAASLVSPRLSLFRAPSTTPVLACTTFCAYSRANPPSQASAHIGSFDAASRVSLLNYSLQKRGVLLLGDGHVAVCSQVEMGNQIQSYPLSPPGLSPFTY